MEKTLILYLFFTSIFSGDLIPIDPPRRRLNDQQKKVLIKTCKYLFFSGLGFGIAYYSKDACTQCAQNCGRVLTDIIEASNNLGNGIIGINSGLSDFKFIIGKYIENCPQYPIFPPSKNPIRDPDLPDLP